MLPQSDITDAPADALGPPAESLSRRFHVRFLLNGPWAPTEIQAEMILHQLANDPVQASVVGIQYRQDPTDNYTCTPPSFCKAQFPQWFCGFANALTQSCSSFPPGATTETSTPEPIEPNNHPETSNPPALNTTSTTVNQRVWVVTRGQTLSGCRNTTDLRPDFVLTSDPNSFSWNHFLVVGKYQYSTSSPKGSKLASYADQVFMAQPFRNSVFGIIASKTEPSLTFWKFDRAGIVGSMGLSYRSSTAHLRRAVRCLCALTRMPVDSLGFHTSSISWNKERSEYPLDETVELSLKFATTTARPSPSDTISLKALVFHIHGFTTKGTRVWEAMMGDTPVMVKYTWCSISESPEESLYQLAHSRGVIGLCNLLYCDTYEDAKLLRSGQLSSTTNEVAKCEVANNRILTRMVLSPAGRSLFRTVINPTGNQMHRPLAVARTILAGVIGHASLFFSAGILHRDITPHNIIALGSPTVVKEPPTPEWLCAQGTRLYGYLIDMDRSTDLNKHKEALGRVGTTMFMAIQVLTGEGSHLYRHDLESFFYTFLWLALYPVSTTTTAPLDPGNDGWLADHPLAIWFNCDRSVAADHKVRNVVLQRSSFLKLLSLFKPEFEEFGHAALRLRKILWGRFVPQGENLVNKDSPAGDVGDEECTIDMVRGPDEVRPGVDNKAAYLEVRGVLEDLISVLETNSV